MATRLQRTQGTATNRKKFTFSAWIKKASNVTGNDQVIYDTNLDANNRITVYFRGSTNNTLNVYGASSGSQIISIETTRVFRDLLGWYHIVLAFDTTQATTADRVKVYVNGTQETSLNSPAYPNQDINLPTGTSSYVHSIGYYTHGGSSVFEGCMSHIHFTDGYAYAASDFGSTDSTTGEWKINTGPNVTYGNNGFFILKNGNSLTDESPNTNNFTVSTGTLTKTEDCPSNVFATLNVLNPVANATYSNGNTTFVNAPNAWENQATTLGASSGKWYCEVRQISDNECLHGIIDLAKKNNSSTYLGSYDGSIGFYPNSSVSTGEIYNEGSVSTYGNTYGDGDILGIAMDLDNHYLYFSINGVWQNSGDPTSGATGTGAAYSLTTGKTYFFCTGDGDGTYINPFDANFGNGYFGTTAVSSAQNPDDGIGIFEYSVPTGYKALCTKSINAQEYS